MHYEIYPDLFFINQFILDLCVLLLTFAIRELKFRPMRILAAAFAGATCSCVLLIPLPIPYIFGILICIPVSLVTMACMISPGAERKVLFKNVCAIVICTFLLGGLKTFLQRKGIGEGLLQQIMVIPVISVFLAAGIHFARRNRKRCFLVTLCFPEGEMVHVKALYDTGNLLKSAEGEGVCIVEKHLCPQTFVTTSNIRYCGLGGQEAYMELGVLERMIIHTGEGDVSYHKTPIALYPGELSKTGKYEAILEQKYSGE